SRGGGHHPRLYLPFAGRSERQGRYSRQPDRSQGDRGRTDGMSDAGALPYRPRAGVMLANRTGRLRVGQRLDSSADAWQMPRGGIDPGEDAEAAARRELEGETGVHAGLVDIIARSRTEHLYALPDDLIGTVWGGRYRGQRQNWFLMR